MNVPHARWLPRAATAAPLLLSLQFSLSERDRKSRPQFLHPPTRGMRRGRSHLSPLPSPASAGVRTCGEAPRWRRPPDVRGSDGKLGVGGGASTGDLLQRAQRGLQRDGHSVADGLRVVGHRVTGALGKPERAHEKERSHVRGTTDTSGSYRSIW